MAANRSSTPVWRTFGLALLLVAPACSTDDTPTQGVNAPGGLDVVFSDLGLDDGGALDAAADGQVDDSDSAAADTGEQKPCSEARGWACPCQSNEDCDSGYCVQGRGNKVCSKACVETCPGGWKCVQNTSRTDLVYMCVPTLVALCQPCNKDGDCHGLGDVEGANRCLPKWVEGAGGEADSIDGSFCGGACQSNGDCPQGYACAEAKTIDGAKVKQCQLKEGECACSNKAVSDELKTECKMSNKHGVCAGVRACEKVGPATSCDAAVAVAEGCNDADDDCDGQTDEGCDDDGDGWCDVELPRRPSAPRGAATATMRTARSTRAPRRSATASTTTATARSTRDLPTAMATARQTASTPMTMATVLTTTRTARR